MQSQIFTYPFFIYPHNKHKVEDKKSIDKVVVIESLFCRISSFLRRYPVTKNTANIIELSHLRGTLGILRKDIPFLMQLSEYDSYVYKEKVQL